MQALSDPRRELAARLSALTEFLPPQLVKSSAWPRQLFETVSQAFVAAPTDAPYTRKLLQRDDECEVMLARWREGGRSAPHDHGLASGAVLVLSGWVEETTYRLTAAGLLVVSQGVHGPGVLLRVAPHTLHAMRALVPAETLHVYAPAIHGMRVYDLERREALTVRDDCAAVLPRDERDIAARMTFAALTWGPR